MGDIDLIFGGASNRYIGQHYGNIIWAQYASNGAININITGINRKNRQ